MKLDLMMELAHQCTPGKWVVCDSNNKNDGDYYGISICAESAEVGDVKYDKVEDAQVAHMCINSEKLPKSRAEAIANSKWFAMTNPHDLSALLCSHQCLISTLSDLVAVLDSAGRDHYEMMCRQALVDAKKLYSDGAW